MAYNINLQSFPFCAFLIEGDQRWRIGYITLVKYAQLNRLTCLAFPWRQKAVKAQLKRRPNLPDLLVLLVCPEILTLDQLGT